MSLPSGAQLVTLPPGTMGFDCNVALDAEGARAWYERGFRHVLRYIPRAAPHSYDLTVSEVLTILDAGLAVAAVQHVENAESWIPSLDKGKAYGANAAGYCARLGLPRGTWVMLDLEGVDPHVPAEQVIAYANAWYGAVKGMGFRPVVYVGWRCGLTADQLYRRLRFDRYVSAYNLNADRYPAVRGVCMRQHVLPNSDRPVGYHDLDGIDRDVVQTDHLGGLPDYLAPAGWTAA